MSIKLLAVALLTLYFAEADGAIWKSCFWMSKDTCTYALPQSLAGGEIFDFDTSKLMCSRFGDGALAEHHDLQNNAGSLDAESLLWIGLQKMANQTKWKWIDGTELDVRKNPNWKWVGEENVTSQNTSFCIAMYDMYDRVILPCSTALPGALCRRPRRIGCHKWQSKSHCLWNEMEQCVSVVTDHNDSFDDPNPDKNCINLEATSQILCTDDNECKNCKVSKWSQWSSCSVTCGVGVKRRERNILKIATDYRYEDFCDMLGLTESYPCNVQKCPEGITTIVFKPISTTATTSRTTLSSSSTTIDATEKAFFISSSVSKSTENSISFISSSTPESSPVVNFRSDTESNSFVFTSPVNLSATTNVSSSIDSPSFIVSSAKESNQIVSFGNEPTSFAPITATGTNATSSVSSGSTESAAFISSNTTESGPMVNAGRSVEPASFLSSMHAETTAMTSVSNSVASSSAEETTSNSFETTVKTNLGWWFISLIVNNIDPTEFSSNSTAESITVSSATLPSASSSSYLPNFLWISEKLKNIATKDSTYNSTDVNDTLAIDIDPSHGFYSTATVSIASHIKPVISKEDLANISGSGGGYSGDVIVKVEDSHEKTDATKSGANLYIIIVIIFVVLVVLLGLFMVIKKLNDRKRGRRTVTISKDSGVQMDEKSEDDKQDSTSSVEPEECTKCVFVNLDKDGKPVSEAASCDHNTKECSCSLANSISVQVDISENDETTGGSVGETSSSADKLPSRLEENWSLYF